MDWPSAVQASHRSDGYDCALRTWLLANSVSRLELPPGHRFQDHTQENAAGELSQRELKGPAFAASLPLRLLSEVFSRICHDSAQDPLVIMTDLLTPVSERDINHN